MNRRLPKEQTGASYLEVLIAAALIAIVLVPMLDAVLPATTSIDRQEQFAVQRFHLTAKMEEVLAEPFVSLDAAAIAAASPTSPTSYSDPLGANNRRLVFLTLYDLDDADADADPFTGGEPEVMWVRVEIEGTVFALESLRQE